MNLLVQNLALAAGSLVPFGVAYLVAMAATRPARVAAGPPTPDLGPEPPAMTNLLANRWRLTQDAGEATLLDLAARGFLELRQPGADPRQTTIHLRPDPPSEPLLPYERRVLRRVQDLAVDGVVPVQELAFRQQERAGQWNRRLRHEVVHDARARGLSRRRLSAVVVTTLSVLAVVGGLGVGVAVFRQVTDAGRPDVVGSLVIGFGVFAVLAWFAGRDVGDRDTSAGRAAAARWLGVRAWLRSHPEFAGLPPAAVAVWGRYLPYGAALGQTRTTSTILDLGTGDRRQVWSTYGGRWRRVRVRYPRLLPRYGKSLPGLLLRSGPAVALGGFLAWFFGPPPSLLPATTADDDVLFPWVASWLAVGLLAYGGYTLLLTLIDAFGARTITGEVLWQQQWRERGSNGGSTPWLDYLAVDDGRSDRTTAWGLPRKLPVPIETRDVVTIRVRPWTRRVISMTVVERGRTRRLRDAPVSDPDPGGFRLVSE